MATTNTTQTDETRRRLLPLRPGLLVNVSTRLRGGVEYSREDLGVVPEGEAELSSWKTEKKIENVEEHKRAVQVQGRFRTIIKSVCIRSSFCLICPTDQEEELYARIAEAEALRDEFNASAVYSQLHGAVLCGRIAESSREAVAAVRTEIRTLIEELNTALSQNSVDGIRSVSSRATQMSRLLEQGTEARTVLERAVKESRRIASDIVKQVKEGAEHAAVVMSAEQVSVIASARLAFDDDELGDIEDTGLALPQVALGTFAGLGEEYVAPVAAAPEPEPVVVEVSAGEVVGETLAGLLTTALTQFGEYTYDDKGPQEVMDVPAAVELLAPLSPAEISRAFGVLMERHGNRGEILIDELTESLPEEVMEEIDALARAVGDVAAEVERAAAAPGIVVPVRSMLEVFSQPGRASSDVPPRPLLPTPPPAPAGSVLAPVETPDGDFEEEEEI